MTREDFQDALRTERHDREMERQQNAELDALVDEAWDREPFDADNYMDEGASL